jgi:hypothetical protein
MQMSCVTHVAFKRLVFYSNLCCDTIRSYDQSPLFRWNILSPSSRLKMFPLNRTWLHSCILQYVATISATCQCKGTNFSVNVCQPRGLNHCGPPPTRLHGVNSEEHNWDLLLNNIHIVSFEDRNMGFYAEVIVLLIHSCKRLPPPPAQKELNFLLLFNSAPWLAAPRSILCVSFTVTCICVKKGLASTLFPTEWQEKKALENVAESETEHKSCGRPVMVSGSARCREHRLVPPRTSGNWNCTLTDMEMSHQHSEWSQLAGWPRLPPVL